MAGRKLYPINKTEMLNFKIDGGVKRCFQELVDREGLTTSEVLRNFVERYVKLKGNEYVPTVKGSDNTGAGKGY